MNHGGGKKRVLVIDDDSDLTEIMSLFLLREGFLVTGASAASQAREALESGPFDLIICDFYLPEMNGAEFISLIRAQGDKTPAIVISGYVSESIRADLGQAGVVGIYQKPISYEQLVKEIHIAIGSYL